MTTPEPGQWGVPQRRRPQAPLGTGPAPLPPASPYGVTAEMFLQSWTDVSTYVYQRDTVTVQRGRQNEASTMQPGQAGLTLNNRDGRFTTRNPIGAYYPNLVQNTPLRLSVPASVAGLSNYLRFEGDTTSSVTTPDKAALQITGPIDVRVDCWPSDYSGNVLAAKWGATATSWAFLLNGTGETALTTFHDISTPGTGTLGFYWWDGSAQQMLDSVLPIPYYGQRICLRVLFTPSTGTAQFFTAPTMAGPFTQLGLNQVFGATTLSAGAGQAVQLGGSLSLNVPPHAYAHTFSSALGMVYEAQILSNVTLVADPVFSAQTAGTASFPDAQSNVWTLGGTSEISSRLYRFHGEMGSFPKAADPSAVDVYSQATAYGITKRLQNSNTPLQSPMRRAYARLPASLRLAAYWPGEDGSAATSIGSALGGPAMQIGGTPNLAANSDFACSAPLPVMNQATFTGSVVTPPGFTWQDNDISFLLEIPAGGEVDGSQLAAFTYAGGTVGYVTVIYNTAGGGVLTFNPFDKPGGTNLGAGASVSPINGLKMRFKYQLVQSGTQVVINVVSLQVGQKVGSSSGPPNLSSATVGQVTRVQFGGTGISGSVMGHFEVQGVADTIFDIFGPLNAWNGEKAAVRVSRLCSEEGIACRIIGPQLASMPMGNQTIDTLMNLLQSCESTDLGMLYEPRQALAVGYRTRSSLYHQSPLSTVSYSGGQLFQGFSATGDTQLAVNDVTATSSSGATARQFISAGAMSVLAPPAGIGRVDTAISPQPQSDGELPQIASWYLGVHGTDDDRYPAIPFQMTRTATPATVPLLDVGDYLQITGTPAWLPPGPVKQLCAGFAETFFPAASWLPTVNGIPELPYETARAGAAAGTAGNAKADTAGSQLTAGITSSATSFQVTTTAGPVWVQAPLQFPFDIVVDREQMTVSAISSATSPQTFIISARSVNGVIMPHAVGAAVSLYRKPIAAL